MSLSSYGAYPDVDNLMAEIRKYDLFEHVVELEAYGMTVVPPEKMQSADGFVDRLRDAIIRTCEKRNGLEIGDYRTASLSRRQAGKSWHLLEEDEVFVEAAINPVNLTLVRWLLGQSAVFSGQTWIIKGEGSPGLGLHSDSHGVPPGAGQIAPHVQRILGVHRLRESGGRADTVRSRQSSLRPRHAAPRGRSLEDTLQIRPTDRQGRVARDLERRHVARVGGPIQSRLAGHAGAELHAQLHARAT